MQDSSWTPQHVDPTKPIASDSLLTASRQAKALRRVEVHALWPSAFFWLGVQDIGQ